LPPVQWLLAQAGEEPVRGVNDFSSDPSGIAENLHLAQIARSP
jgi:hypothetical protein